MFDINKLIYRLTMNNKIKYEMLLLVLIIIVIFNTTIILNSNDVDTSKNGYNITAIGSNENGTVYKVVAGNMSSDETVGIILGVHPREHEIHDAINKTIHNITGENGTNNLTKKYVIYFIKTHDNLTSREDTRPAGETLANKFIVPNIKSDNPFIVVDVHEIDPNYEYSNFIFSISKNSTKINSYLEKLSSDVNLVNYQFDEGTSPEKVTKPIANQGINTLLMETSIQNSLSEKQKTAENLIQCLDQLKP